MRSTSSSRESWTPRWRAAWRRSALPRMPTNRLLWVNQTVHIERDTYHDLPYWAAAAGQTPQRILGAVRQLAQLAEDSPPGGNEIKSQYVRIRRELDGETAAFGERIDAPAEARQLAPFTALWLKLPWERARAIRLLNLLAHEQLHELSQAEVAARRGKKIDLPVILAGRTDTELPYASQRTIYLPPIAYDPAMQGAIAIHDYAAMVMCRRATRVLMAMEAWKLEHGELPQSLKNWSAPISTAPRSIRMPAWPSNTFPRAWGLLKRQWLPLASLDCFSGEIAAGQPFIWSMGPRIQYSSSLELAESEKRPLYQRCWIHDGSWP